MNGLELRPLSLGEILDRTFSLYRRQFLLFAGISAIPSAIVLVFELARSVLLPNPFVAGATVAQSPLAAAMWGLSAFVSYVLSSLSYTVAMAGIVYAVADLHLGRATSMAQSVRHVLSEFWSVVGIVWLNGLAVLLGVVLLVIPGIYFACRLLVCLPAGLIEKRGPGDSITRSKNLTSGFAGRSFIILLLYIVITYSLWIGMAILVAAGPGLVSKDPATMRLATILLQLGGFVIGSIATPILAIAISVFYFDLRVRKEGFDLQFMMNPDSERSTPSDRGLSLLP
ncbi:hypothetical protein [Paludibaculum fermentans]|uniref:Glycerophosphoryl diester phosphodiesterase membrane domain-containing protein n=1 Tax=Paludibaculum fermentans TaxID=1473598 RepID=A0A7S7NPI8_PALFE|nr:hypothetical protein [Paludibaculum fermentans]QOY87407.1 hypothetical protein IRI77_32375 [Paludibaculum fermentans]